MADLVSLAEVKRFLGVEGGADDAVLDPVLDQLEELFEAECNRRERPFAKALAGRVEVRPGTGTSLLVLDYPIASLTSVTLGRTAATPEETLDVADVDVLVYVAGRRIIERTDGGTFGTRGSPRYVRVTYTTQDDLPPIARLAITRGAAAIYRQLGAEDVTAERLATYSRDLAPALASDPLWARAVAACWEARL